MEQNLGRLFERALDDEPHPPPGDLAAEAMASGARMRRKRRLLAGSAAAVAVVALATSGVLSWQSMQPDAARPGILPAAAPPLTAPRPGCTSPVDQGATDVAIFLVMGVTEDQQRALSEALDADVRVHEWTYESREQAYEKFQTLWKDSPDFVASVGPESLPEAFRVVLGNPRESRLFERDMLRMAGVEDVVGSQCP